MNILTDLLPTSVKVSGFTYEIETDFRAGVSFALMVEKGEDNILKLCEPFFSKGLPLNNLEGAIEAILYFFRGGDVVEDNTPKQSSKPAYSFDMDNEAIYADFWRFYNIDLAQDNLHWWTFRSLLMGLPEDSNFKMRIYYRTCNLKELPKKEQKRIAKIRKEIEIKKTETGKITLEQRNKQMLDYVTKRGNDTRGVKIWQTEV